MLRWLEPLAPYIAARRSGNTQERWIGPMTIDVDGRLLYVFSFANGTGSIYAVNLFSGDRSLVSGPDRGRGTAIPSAMSPALPPT